MTRPVIPEGTLIEVSLTIRLPHAASPEHVSEWLNMEIGHFGSIAIDNPLANDEPQSFGFSMPQWIDTGLNGREIQSKHIKSKDGFTYYSTRYVAETQS